MDGGRGKRVRRLVIAAALWICCAVAAAAAPVERTWTVDGVERKALLVVPPDAARTPAPVVFAFHGHGGTMRSAARKFAFDTLWPEAIVVYMQCLPTPGALTDPDGMKPGWQSAEGVLKDRDLRFFDVALAALKKDFKVDDGRIFATGHSNGGGFTYLLWAVRGDVFAAVAPAAAIAGRVLARLKPKPVMHVAGRNDTLVRFAWQERTMAAMRQLNGCDAVAKPWASAGTSVGTLYSSKAGPPFVSVIYSGSHALPDEAPELIVKFFKEQAVVKAPAGVAR